MKKLFSLLLSICSFVSLNAADYYWVNNGGNWSDLSHWSNSSGGPGNAYASPPTSVDTVYFDANSFSSTGQTVLVNVTAECHTLDLSAVSNHPFFYMNNWSYDLNIYGSLILGSDADYEFRTVFFWSDSTGNVITINGVNEERIYYFGEWYFEGNGRWTLTDDLRANRIYHDNGYLDMSGRLVDLGTYDLYSYGDIYDTLDLSGAEVYMDDFDPGGCTVILTGTTYHMMGSSSTFNHPGDPSLDIVVEGIGQFPSQDLTLDDLILLPGSEMRIYSSWTVSATAVTATGTRNKPISLYSSSSGNPGYLFSNSSVNADYLIVQDIYASGAIPFVATNSVDVSGNSGWTITPPVYLDYYWVGDGGNWSDLSHWSSTSGGSPDMSEPPSLFDDVFFDGYSFTAGEQSVTIDDTAYCKDFDMSAVTNSPSIWNSSWSFSLNVYGSFTLSGNASYSFQNVNLQSSESGNIITSQGSYLGTNSNLNIYGSGSWQLADSLSGSYLNQYGGYLDFNGQSVNLGSYGALVISGIDSLNMENASLYTRDVYNYSSDVLQTVNSTIYFLNASSGNLYGGYGYPNLYHDIVVDGYLNISSNNSFNEITVLPGSEVRLPSGQTQTVNKFTASGSKFAVTDIYSSSGGSPAYLEQNIDSVVIEWVTLKDIAAMGVTPFKAYNSTDNSGNTEWEIYPPTSSEYYWIGGTGNWGDPSNWSTESGGAPDQTERPSRYDNVIFDDNSFSATGQVVTIDTLQFCNSLEMYDIGFNPTLYMDNSYGELEVSGSFWLSPDAGYDLNEIHFISGDQYNEVDPWGMDLGDNARFYFEGEGSWTLMDSLNVGYLYYNNGYLDLGGSTVNMGENGDFYAYGTTGDTLDMSWTSIYTGSFYSNSNQVLLTEGSEIHMIGSGDFSGSYNTFYDLYIYDNTWFYNETDTFNSIELLPGSQVYFPSGYTQTMTDFYATGTKTGEIDINSTSGGAATLESYNPVWVEWVNVKDIAAAGNTPFVADNSYDLGGNTNWEINPPTGTSYYWVGDGGNWSDLSHWSSIPGGTADMAELPSKLDSVFFDEQSFSVGGQTVTLDGAEFTMKNLDMSAIDEQVTVELQEYGQDLYIHGSMVLSDLVTILAPDYHEFYFMSDSTGNVIDFAGAEFPNVYHQVFINGKGSYTLMDSLSCRNLYIYSGTVNFNDQPVYISLDIGIDSDGDAVEVHLNGSEITVGDDWIMSSDNVVFDAGSSTIIIDGGGGRNFYGDYDGDTLVYNDLVLKTSNTNFYHNSVFNNLTIYNADVYFQDGTTNQVNNLYGQGTTDDYLYLYTQSGGIAYLKDTSGTSSVSYARIRGIHAIGGAVFEAVESMDDGNISGWSFVSDTDPPEFIPGYPYVDAVHEEYLNLAVRMDEGATVYLVLLNDGAAAPTVSEVVNGTASGLIDWDDFTISDIDEVFYREVWGLSPETPYDIYLVAVDMASTPNTQDTTTLVEVTTGSARPPEFVVMPYIGDVREQYANIFTEVDEYADIYYVVLPDGADKPTAQEVRNGTGSGGEAVITWGSVYFNAFDLDNVYISPLPGDSAMDVYLVALDQATPRNLQDTAVRLDIVTDPYEAPVFEASPYIGGSYDYGFDVVFDMDEPCYINYVVMPDGSVQPTVQEVLNGTGSGGVVPEASGQLNIGGTSVYWRTISGLEETTTYDIYLVAKDYVNPPNVRDSVIKLDGTTTVDNNPPYFWDYGEEFTDNEKVLISVELNEKGRVYYVLVHDTTVYPGAAEVFAGQGPGGSSVVAADTIICDQLNQYFYETITGLSPLTDYDIYLTAEDDSDPANQMTYVEKIDISTTRAPMDYFWVGDGGDWSDLSHWVTSSGGSTNHTELPTLIDNVYFDENSFTTTGQQVTVYQNTYVNTLDMSGVTNQPGFDHYSTLYVYGDLVVPDSVDYYFWNIYLRGSDTSDISVTTSDDGTDNLYYLYADGPGYYHFTGSDSLYVRYTFYHREGTVVIDHPVFFSGLNINYDYRVKELIINADRMDINYIDNYVPPAAYPITAPGTDIRIHQQISGSGVYPNVILTGNNVSLYGSNTFDTLTVKEGITLNLESGKTTTVGQLFAAGQKTGLITIRAITEGSQATINQAAGTVDAGYLLLQDNNATGGAVFNAVNSIDAGNNSGWNIAAPVFSDYYWVGGTGSWSDLGHWSTTSGGVADHTQLPGRFENAIFNENSFDATGTVTLDMDTEVKDLDFSSVDEQVTVNTPDYKWFYIYGSLLLPDEISWQVYNISFKSDSSGNIIRNGRHLRYVNIYFDGTGDYSLSDSASMQWVYLTSGTLDLNDQPVRFYGFNPNGGTSKTLDLGSSRIWVDNQWTMSASSIIFDAGTSTILLDGGSFYADQNALGLMYHDVVFSSSVYLYNSSYFNSLDLMPGAQLYAQYGRTFTFDQFSAPGTEAQPVMIHSNSNGNQAIFSKADGEITVYHADIKDVRATGGAAFNAYFSDTTNSPGWTLLKAAQTVSFDTLTYVDYDPLGLQLTASATSGDTITYELLDGDGAISADTLYPNRADSFLVRAYQPGNEYYLPSDTAEHIYVVRKLDQVITFAPLADKVVTDDPFDLSAIASSGLAVSFSVSGPATLSGNTVTLTGETGTVIVTASQAGNDIYKPAELTRSFSVNDITKLDQTVSFDSIMDFTYGDEWVVMNAVSSLDLPVTFQVSSGSVTIVGDTAFLGDAGEIEIIAIQAGNDTVNPATPVTRTFTVHKASQSINMTAIPQLAIGDEHTLTASATSGLKVVFKVNSGSASIAGDTLYIEGGGTVILSAYQGGSNNYLPADSVTTQLDIVKASQVIQFQAFADLQITSPPVALTTTASSGLPLTFWVSGPAVVSNDTIYLTGVSGVVTVHAIQAGNEDYNPAEDSASFAVTDPGKTDQTITFDEIPDVSFGDGFVEVTATATSGLTVTFQIVSGPATVSQDTVYLTGAGTVTVKALQAGNETYNPALTETRSFTVTKTTQTIDFPAIPAQVFGGDPYPLDAVASSGLTVSYTVISGKAQVINDTLHFTGAGSVTISATQTGNVNYYAAPSVMRSFSVAKADQQVSFQDFSGVTVSDGPFVLTTTVTSGLALTHSVSGPATLSSGSLTLSGTTGIVTLRASQAGNFDYNPVTDSVVFNVTDPGKANQTITFDPIADHTYGDGSITLSASATSGLTVEFAVASGSASVSGSTLTIEGAGVITVDAMQEGDATYNPAPMVSRSFNVAKASQTITFANIPDLTFGDDPYLMSATASSGLPVTVLVNEGNATVSGGSLVLNGAGLITVTAYQYGNENYLEADSVFQQVIVGKASQQIIFQSFPDVEIDDPPIILTCSATSGLPVTYGVSGPATLSGDTLTLTGVPGDVTVTVSQAGNVDYYSVSSNTSFTVRDPNKTDQAISFDPLSDVELRVGTVTLDASTTSGLTVTFGISGPGTLSGNVITLTDTGTITVTAMQDGDADYNPAPDVVRSFRVLENTPCPDQVDWPDTSVCSGDTLTLVTTMAAGHSYSWVKIGTTDTITGIEIIITEEGDYLYKEVLNSTRCAVTDEFTVTYLPLPEFGYSIIPAEIDPENNASVTLDNDTLSYVFTPGDDVIHVSGLVYNVSPSVNTIFVVTGTASTGCSSDINVPVYVRCAPCSDTTMFSTTGSFNHGCTNRNYRNSANCTWTVFPSGSVNGVMIEFDTASFDIKSGDELRIYSGTDANGTLIDTYYNDNLPPADGVWVPGTAAFIHFVSNATVTGGGFQASYTVIMTGVDNALDSYINLYPNPNSGTFTLEISPATFSEAEAEIYSSLGQKVWNRKLEPVNGSVRERVELVNIPDGLYYLRIITGEGTYHKAIILE